MKRWTRPGRPKVSKGKPGFAHLTGGPFGGRCIKVHTSDGKTLTFSVNGQTGRYVKNEWSPSDV